METIYIIIPIYNGQENIENLSKNCQKIVSDFSQERKIKFVFVNDGSTDSTEHYIKRYFEFANTTILKHTKNQGPGAAFATGFEYLSQYLQSTDWVLTMEGDNTSSHELVGKMFRRTKEGYDVILASPFIYGGTIINTSRFRKLLSFGSNLILRELLGLRGIFTMSSFFRLYRGSVILQLQTLFGAKLIESKGFEGVVELLMKMVFIDTLISEIPLILDTAKSKGKSKMKIFKTIVNLLMLFRHKARWKSIAEQATLMGNYDGALSRTL